MLLNPVNAECITVKTYCVKHHCSTPLNFIYQLVKIPKNTICVMIDFITNTEAATHFFLNLSNSTKYNYLT